MALRGNGTIPAVYSARLRLAKHTGMQIMELVEQNIRPRDIMTRRRLPQRRDGRYGARLLHQHHAAPARHRPRGRCRASDLDMVNEISEKTPNLCHLAPAGDTFMEDLDAGGRRVGRHEGADASRTCSTPPLMTCHRQDRGRKPRRTSKTATRRSSAHWIAPTPGPAASPCSTATWPPTAASLSSPPSRLR